MESLSLNSVVIEATSSVVVAPSAMMENVTLWGPDNPALYTLKATISGQDGEEMDSVSVRFGFRKAVFDPDKGLIFNGKPLKMYDCSLACQIVMD